MPKKPVAPKPPSEFALKLRYKDDTKDEAMAYYLLRPELQAASTIQKLEGDIVNVNALIGELDYQTSEVRKGNIGRLEDMLVTQAHTLNELFNNLTKRAKSNMEAGYLDASETYLRVALKAQSQCRATVETLAEVKNPRQVAFVRQANIAHGPQQVNNGQAAEGCAGNSGNAANKQSGGGNELLQDSRAQSIEGQTYQALEAVGAVNGAKD